MDDLPRLPPRRDDAHKGDFGPALIVGGSRGMAGAAALAGMAAFRGGAGLVRLAVPEPCLETIAGFEPSYMTVPLPADDAGRIAPAAFEPIVELAEPATAWPADRGWAARRAWTSSCSGSIRSWPSRWSSTPTP